MAKKSVKKTTRKVKTPKLKPGTYSALDVLQFVYDLAKAEPKRLKMSDWVSAFKGFSPFNEPIDASVKKTLPACGTAACIGGWVNLVIDEDVLGGGMTALRKLGLTGPAFMDLEYLMGQGSLPARSAIRQLRLYIAKHKDYLSAKTVQVNE